MELTTLLPAIAGILFLIQAVYYLGLYRNLYTHVRKEKAEADTPPLSVILVAKDAATDLQQNLPAILGQDYPEFEVIVIYDRSSEDDCGDVLKRLSDQYPNLYHSFIPDSARYISHKKLGVTMGIKASRYDWLVFTEPDCCPESDQWLRRLARNFTPDTDLVLGYSNYRRSKGWFNRKITFDTLLNAMRWMGMAIGRHPYMGSGRNLAYRKSLYYDRKGFTNQLTLQRGEDDLFVNRVATARNTRVEVSPESIVRITPPQYKRTWREERLNYMTTSRYFKGIARYLMGLETCSRLLFLLAVIVSIVWGILNHQWLVVGVVALLWLLRFVMQFLVFRRTSIALGERKFCFTLWLFDWMQPLWNFRLKTVQRFRRKDEFMRK